MCEYRYKRSDTAAGEKTGERAPPPAMLVQAAAGDRIEHGWQSGAADYIALAAAG